VEEDVSFSSQMISHDVFTFGIEKEDLEAVPFSQDEVFGAHQALMTI
jgi:hypothetical protein